MSRKWIFYLCFLTLTQCSKCKQDDPAPKPPVNQIDLLPLATQSGNRTFGCLLNGRAWNLSGSPFAGPSFTSHYFNRRLSLAAHGTSVLDGTITGGIIQINVDSISVAGRFILSKADTNAVTYDSFSSNCTYRTDATHPATIDITRLDLVNRIVSGRFSFTLETPTCDKVVVTEGRFDSRF